MASIDDIVNKLLNTARELGITAEVDEYGREKIVILNLAEDFSIYVSVVCNNECDVEYAIGDDNFIFKPKQLDFLKRSVEIIESINNEIIKSP
ncbi:hypothetical protein [Vulcanisaeta souniana]|uniref:Uncharacterized protein n=1 Tax=Vulcanisaeta souniana JCM 11219 TaxID=1293586 RepID=A0A830E983_9CREN|nr:hypothetical protein [Vulcanisaeta souniana]BDR93368.1 hypothetical protein Vsou_24610 [Vulcanisaeta souniana JCM 11219]GGI76617.1 hypothetical protein GCM10007112_11740 [Vulcanisaeta souniana JCM 11219]